MITYLFIDSTFFIAQLIRDHILGARGYNTYIQHKNIV